MAAKHGPVTPAPSSPMRILAACFFCLAALMTRASLARAVDLGSSVVKEGRIEEDLYLAGSRVLVSGIVSGDVIAAGGSVAVEKLVAGDVIAAGGFVEVRGNVSGDVRAAAGGVTIAGRVGRNLLGVGETVRLAADSLVEGRTMLAGGTVDVDGRVEGSLKAAAGRVRIAGHILGDATLVAQKIEIQSGARIDGSLSYRSPAEIVVHDGAVVSGGIKLIRPEMSRTVSRLGRAAAVFIGALLFGPVVIGLLLILATPKFSIGAARQIGSEPLKAFIIGLLVILLMPLVGVVSLLTIIGIPLGLAVLALLPVALLIGVLHAAFFLGDKGGRVLGWDQDIKRGREMAAFIVAIVGLALISGIPAIGGLAVGILACAGLGAFAGRVYRSFGAPNRNHGG